LLYLHGLSSGDFVPALGQFLGSAAGLSAALHEEYGAACSDYVLSRHPDNTNCPEPGVIRTGHAQLLVIAMTLFRSTT